MIVAPHGAGLSNMVVSPLHTPVLEIGPGICPTCFLQLALKVSVLQYDLPDREGHQVRGAWGKTGEAAC